MKIKNLFKFGKKNSTVSNKIITVDFVGKTGQSVLMYTPYGMFYNVPENALVGLLADQGNEESLLGLVTDIENREDLEEGEVAVGIPSNSNRIYFKTDGSIIIQNDKGNYTIDADGIHIFNDGTDFAVAFEDLTTAFTNQDTATNAEFTKLTTTISAMVTAFAALGVTIPPYVQGTITTDISGAKVEDVKLP